VLFLVAGKRRLQDIRSALSRYKRWHLQHPPTEGALGPFEKEPSGPRIAGFFSVVARSAASSQASRGRQCKDTATEKAWNGPGFVHVGRPAASHGSSGLLAPVPPWSATRRGCLLSSASCRSEARRGVRTSFLCGPPHPRTRTPPCRFVSAARRARAPIGPTCSRSTLAASQLACSATPEVARRDVRSGAGSAPPHAGFLPPRGAGWKVTRTQGWILGGAFPPVGGVARSGGRASSPPPALPGALWRPS
jgi:hypothetical protein